ncbi:unnamed protein product [Alopecurus aequalis]
MGATASPNLHVPLIGARPAPDDERPRRPWRTICRDVLVFSVWSLIVLYFIWFIAYFTYIIVTSGAVQYSVAITGVDGLDPTIDLRSDRRPTLSPVFNLTLYIKEFDKIIYGECIGGHSAEIVVSYHNAFLGKGAVPLLCVSSMQEDGVATMAWGDNVVVPRFLRDRLAGELEHDEAVLDVMVTDAPTYHGQVLACKANIGGGRCPCQFEF